jgi:serine/threonine protein phosphatase PrpC
MDEALASKVIQRYASPYFNVGLATMQGHRSTMEDAHAISLSLPNHPETSCFAVFDGHGGRQCASWLEDNFWPNIDSVITLPSPVSNETAMDVVIMPWSDDELIQKCMAMDASIIKIQHGEVQQAVNDEPLSLSSTPSPEPPSSSVVSESPRAQMPNLPTDSFLASSHATEQEDQWDNDFCEEDEDDDISGSTAVFCLINHCMASTSEDAPVALNELPVVIGNIGDSRAFMMKDDKPQSLTNDHLPGNPVEWKRINVAGGYVYRGRVDGQLAMSRAFGDPHYKKASSLAPQDQKVIAQPDVVRTTLKRNSSDFLVLCCDGLLESLDEAFILRFIQQWLPTIPDLAVLAALLIDLALLLGSNDNMTLMIIQAKDGMVTPQAFSSPNEASLSRIVFQTATSLIEHEYLPQRFDDKSKCEPYLQAYSLFSLRFGMSAGESHDLAVKNKDSGYYPRKIWCAGTVLAMSAPDVNPDILVKMKKLARQAKEGAAAASLVALANGDTNPDCLMNQDTPESPS